jgi:hypothetical protein
MLMAYCFASCLILHFMHCIISTLAHIQLFYTLDHAELESEVQTEQAQVNAFTNLALDQGKLRCITPQSLTFILNLISLC